MGCIHHDIQVVQTELAGKRVLGVDDISSRRVIEAFRTADAGTGDLTSAEIGIFHQAFDFGFILVGQLVPVGTEQLDAVVFVGVVTRADHDAGVRPH